MQESRRTAQAVLLWATKHERMVYNIYLLAILIFSVDVPLVHATSQIDSCFPHVCWTGRQGWSGPWWSTQCKARRFVWRKLAWRLTSLQRQLKGETPLDAGLGAVRTLSVIDKRGIIWDPANIKKKRAKPQLSYISINLLIYTKGSDMKSPLSWEMRIV